MLPQMGDAVEGMMEACAQQTAQGAHQQAKKAPFEKGFEIALGMIDFIQPSHKNSPFLSFFLFYHTS
jgi:hypothetical protein